MTTAQGLTGSLGRLVGWVQASWNEIQEAHDDWDWMRSSNLLGSGASFAPASGQYTSTLGTGAGTVGVPVANFGKWARDTFRSYITSAGSPALGSEMFLDWLPYDSWRDSYMLGAMRSVTTRPVSFAIGPDKSINLGPPPNGLYTITGDFWMAPTQMSADTDQPTGLNSQYHMAIVYRAMQKYGSYEAAPEVLDRGMTEYKRIMKPLEAVYLPEISFAGSL